MRRLRVAIQMDDPAHCNPETDTTLHIAREGLARGHEISWCLAQALTWRADGLSTSLAPFGQDGPPSRRPLAEFDVFLVRQDPPFDMAYVTGTHLLELADLLVVNDPRGLRDRPEKLSVLNYPDLLPKTLIGRDVDELRRFRADVGDIILKPLFGNGGASIFLVKQDDRNFNALCETFLSASREPLIAQAFLPQVEEGDKRVLLVDGKPVGAINRLPAGGEIRANLHAGGRAAASDLTERDREICTAIGDDLLSTGQILAGIDIIGGCLTEINVTSPTGFVELERLAGINASRMLWEAIETRLEDKG